MNPRSITNPRRIVKQVGAGLFLVGSLTAAVNLFAPPSGGLEENLRHLQGIVDQVRATNPGLEIKSPYDNPRFSEQISAQQDREKIFFYRELAGAAVGAGIYLMARLSDPNRRRKSTYSQADPEAVEDFVTNMKEDDHIIGDR